MDLSLQEISMRYSHIIITLFFVLRCVSANAQSGKLFSVDNDLSSSLINNIYQDHNNIIWIATQDGLNRYDGSKFTIYRNNKKDSTSLLHNYVRVIYQDRKNHLFIGFFNGLQVYQYDTDSFIEIPLILENGSKYPSHVTSIFQRRNGDVLIGTTGHGVFILRRKGTSVWADQRTDFVPSYLISFIYEDAQQNLWIGTQDKGLFLVGKDKPVRNYFSGDHESIHGICEDVSGNLYVGSDVNGLCKFDQDSQTFHPTPYKHSPLAVNTLYKNNAGDILIGTEGSGVKIFNPEKGEISEGNFNIDTFDFSKSKVHAVLEDKAGNIWLGIYQKGVILLPVKNKKFEYYGHKSIKNDVIGSNNVTALYTDRKGNIWVGTDGDGIYKLDANGNQSAHFEPSSGSTGTPSSIFSIFEDSENTLWIGSYDRGLCKLNATSGKCTYINDALPYIANQTLRIFAITEDKNKNLWVGTLGSGLYSININTLEVNHYKASTGSEYRPEANVLNNDWIESLLLTRDEKLYIGTMDGLGCLDLKSREFTSTFGGKNRIFSGTPIHALYEDSANTVWVGTSDGIVSMQPEQGLQAITRYTTDDGLPSNEIHAIREDALGSLWISTNYGITRFDLENRTFINYYSGDGLQGNEFTGAVATGNDGKLAFGGINGITLFNPKEIVNDVKKLTVRITGFYIHNRSVNKGMKSGNYDIIQSSVFDADTFHLAYTDNSFSVEFSAMAFSNPERITYLYSLGDDDDWITMQPGTGSVTFNNLSPGEYTFQVKAKDYNNYSDPKVIHIIIHPAWYFSFWAKCAYVFILLAVAFIITQQIRQRQRTKREMLEHVHAQQITEAKLQFFINIAHEIRTPMTLIISPLKKLINKDKDRERKRSYFLMNRNSERILHLVNQLMDIQKIDKGQMMLRFQETEVVEYISELCHVFDEQTVGKHIKLQYIHDMDELYAWIDPNNFDKVILNVLSNALNFTPDFGTITVSLLVTQMEKSADTSTQDYLQIIISDTGTGIPDNELEKVFDCFYQTREKKRSSTGTGIGLYLTRSIVELHHGTIRAENNLDGPGCRFMIRLPLGADHLKSEQIVSERYAPGAKKEHFSQALPAVMDHSETKIKARNKHRLMVVDDDQQIRKYICDEMAADYHMIECCNGKEALSLILQNPPDLIISDIMMPEMDGTTLCVKIKQNVNINHIPVILLTAKAEEEDNLEGLGIGADAYIIKPFNIELLRVTVQTIIKNRHILKNNFTGNQNQQDKVTDVAIVSSDEKLLSRIMETINTNIDNPALNVEMLTREVGISRVHLHRKLKELTNQTTRDLIRNIRLQQAAKLLSEKQLNISEVAFAVGFTNVAHFSNAFKEFYGIPPTTYMENQLNNQKKKQHPLAHE